MRETVGPTSWWDEHSARMGGVIGHSVEHLIKASYGCDHDSWLELGSGVVLQVWDEEVWDEREPARRMPSYGSLWRGIPRLGQVTRHFGFDEMGCQGCSQSAWDFTLFIDTCCS